LGRIEDYMAAREEGDGVEGFEITKVFKDSQCPYVQEEVWSQVYMDLCLACNNRSYNGC